ncbi:hypothetical protein Tco_0222053 [Tanacetum coccineum]
MTDGMPGEGRLDALVIWRVLKVRGENELKRIRGLVGAPRKMRIGFVWEFCRRSDVDLRRFVSGLKSLEGKRSGMIEELSRVRVRCDGGIRVATLKMIVGVSEGREDVCDVFQQRGSRAKRKLSRCRRNQMGNEPILALPEGADDFVVLMKDCMANVVSPWRGVVRLERQDKFDRRGQILDEFWTLWINKFLKGNGFGRAMKHDRLMAFIDLIGSKRDRLITVSCLSERDRLIVVMFCVRIELIRFKGELHENTKDREILFLYCMSPPIRRKYHNSVAFAIGCKRIKNSKRCNRKIGIPIAMWPCRVEEKMTLKEVDGQTVEEIETKIIAKDGTITRVPRKFQGYETSKEEPFAPHRLPQPKGNLNGWLIEDEEEVERNEVDSNLESTASSKPM